MASRMWAARGAAIACSGVLLASCGGGGGGDGSGQAVDKPVATVPGCVPGGSATGANVLFGADLNTGTLTAFKTLTPSCEVWESHVFATVTRVANGIAYDARRDELYVLAVQEYGPQEVDVYAHASVLAPGATPTRSITLSAFAIARAISLDTAQDRLWVGGERTTWADDGGEIDMYENASTRSGPAVADRQIRNIPGVVNMALDTTHAILYAVAGVHDSVMAFAGTDTLTDGATPTFTIGGTAGSFGIAIDGARDIAYLPNPASGLRIVRHASTGLPDTAIMVPFDGAKALMATVDSKNDRLYLGGFAGAYVIDHASALTPSSPLPAPAASAASSVVIGGFAMP